MDRRRFLKNMFGAAVIAAMPKIVVNQIETLPPLTVPPPVSPIINGVKPIFQKKIEIPKGGLLYMWDDEKGLLVAASEDFSINFTRHSLDISSWEEGYVHYIPRLGEWRINTNRILWKENPEPYFQETKKLRCLIAKDNYKIDGEVYIHQMTMDCPVDKVIFYDAEFMGSGALIIEKEE